MCDPTDRSGTEAEDMYYASMPIEMRELGATAKGRKVLKVIASKPPTYIVDVAKTVLEVAERNAAWRKQRALAEKKRRNR